ncbi:circadian clock KaiB family protein [Hymenobacter jeollabukensis]|uniref:Circadian clock protein KaiB n=1 Tax=Hymenobacter jeollabukensis TaxID=2025313 RepID=A0A5R8WVA5_9BACT|nr:circadian clock KaiB family protein [Hymenobacter jeollabukensis]TLM96450.1 circadian clock protein KaiB [Hymenobacter jeollabukensis]
MEPEQAPDSAGPEYVLHLFITGATPNSTQAVRNLQDICERYLPGRCELQIVDIYQQPELARAERIVAAPTLIKKQPGLVRFLVGDLSDRRRVLSLLGLVPDPNDPYLHD